MSDTKPLPDDPDRTAATPATPDPTAAAADRTTADQAAAERAAAERAAASPPPADPTPGEPVWAAEPAPAPAATPAAAAPAPAPPGPAGPGRPYTTGERLRQSRVRVPVLVGAAGLVLGCCLGAGIVAAGVAVFGDHHRGDDRGRITRDDRGPRGPMVRDGERGDPKRIRPGDGFRKQPFPTPPATTPAPSPSAS
ncbi:hypothetical protein AB0K00_16870 [Dactylosporangium sp. NPDC049525]|uniref:hypothetical protein n=1 Tax=Dactylosporangium sp. NPDC049525 TaxID=3154730 RepID=UPI003438AE66